LVGGLKQVSSSDRLAYITEPLVNIPLKQEIETAKKRACRFKWVLHQK